MELKKSAQICKNEKTQHLIRCFKSKKQFKIKFLNFCLFLAYFEQKVAKNVFFCDFLQKLWVFGQNLTLLMWDLWNSLSENVYFYVRTIMNLLRSYVTKSKYPNVKS